MCTVIPVQLQTNMQGDGDIPSDYCNLACGYCMASVQHPCSSHTVCM